MEKRLYLFIFTISFFVVALNGFGQSQYTDYLRDYTPLDKEKFSEIKCKDIPIKMIGWVTKQKQFADGSPFELWDESDTESKLMLKGTVRNEGDETLVTGTVFCDDVSGQNVCKWDEKASRKVGIGNLLSTIYGSEEAGRQFSIVGTFKVWNTVDGTLKADRKSQKIKDRPVPLSVAIKDVEHCNSIIEVCFGDSRKTKADAYITFHQQKTDGGMYKEWIEPEEFSRYWNRRPVYVGRLRSEFNNKVHLSDDDWIIEFENGDKWVGELAWAHSEYRRYPVLANEYSIGKDIKGCYIFANGDAIQGSLPIKFVFFASDKFPDQFLSLWNYNGFSKICFEDGQEMNCEEFEKWGREVKSLIDDEHRKELWDKSSTLSEYRDNIGIFIENLERQKQIRKAQIQDRRNQLKQYALKNYGRFGNDVCNGRVAIGMTEEMVETALKLRFSYAASQLNVLASSGASGLNPDPDVYEFHNIYTPVHQSGTTRTYRLSRMAEAIIGNAYSTLTFKNGKLSEISAGKRHRYF